ncbi:MAG: hypothetical protein CL764_00345 [Chloroflexi bacterium]|nr:hypothetical protein [Chloroflexota bacterium]|tara:strand:- start:143 stop:829 length:687 start_codon:yes stop_codon:yes gene_type:complete
MINVKIYFFASIRENFGKKILDFQVQNGSTISQLISTLEREFNLTSIHNCMVAIDMKYVDKNYIIKKYEEIYLIPPVSGGNEENLEFDDQIIIDENVILKDQIIESFFSHEDGAVVFFYGVTRNNHDNKTVISLEYESLIPMAKNEINKIFVSIHRKWNVSKIVLLHRLGKLYPGEISMLIGISSKHRKPAIQSIDYLIDELKKTVPIWKKEIYDVGEEWIEDNITSY